MLQQLLSDCSPEYHFRRAEETSGYVACPEGVTDCKSCHLDSACNPREGTPSPKPRSGKRAKP